MKPSKTQRTARKRGQTVSCISEQQGEYETFSSALKKVLTVSHKEMQKRITHASSARASSAKD